MKINEAYHGFKLVDVHDVEEIKSKAHIFYHEKSGAKLLYLKNDDPDKVFSVAFRTPPEDSTGVPHIIEHCVLSGSRKYKTKEPFMDMVKGSLKTFINAMTFSDKTIYPVSSKNDQDFMNLMDVYLDSVFFPMIYEDETIFMQEGWHHSILDPSEKVTYNGVVYNEMRGAYSQPTTVLREYIGASLFPDTTYKYSSGGNPDQISNLSFEDFKNFHKKFYQPSNAYLFIYGDGDIDTYLKRIHDEYLIHFDLESVDSKIPLQAPFESANHLEATYAIGEQEEEDQKTYLSMNFVIGDGSLPEVHLLGEIFKEILVHAEGAPIKEALLNAGIGQDIMCSVGGGRQLYLSIIAKNAQKDQKEAFSQIILENLQKMAEEKIDRDLLASAINIAEYDLREGTGFPTKGIIYHILSMNSWLYDGHPTSMLSYDKDLTALKAQMSGDYFENFIKQALIENPHSSLVVLSPEKGLNERKNKKIEEKLSDFKNTLSDGEIETLIEKNKLLKKKQLAPDSQAARDTIPKLKIDDVEPNAEKIPTEVVKDQDITLLKHDIFTNDIMYLEYLFDTRMVAKENIPYIHLFAELMGKLSTETMAYGPLNSAIYKETGGIDFTTRNYQYLDGSGYEPKLVVSGKAILDQVPQLMTLTNQLLTESRFDEKKRIKELLLQHQSRLQMSIENRGDQYASMKVSSYLSDKGSYNEISKGFSYYWFISDLLKNFDANYEDMIETLKTLYGQIFNKKNLIISVTGDQSVQDAYSKHGLVVTEGLRNESPQIQKYNFDVEVKNEAIVSASSVQYVAKGFDFKPFDQTYKGSMQVLKSILNADYLHDRIRAQNGAYGCGISFSETGQVIATSYRDPKLKETLDIFKDASDYIKNLDMDQETLSQHIIGAISRIDSAMTPRGQGVLGTSEYIVKRSYEAKQRERTEILSTTIEDIKGFCDLLYKGMNEKCHCVYGNEGTVKENSDLFANIKSLHP